MLTGSWNELKPKNVAADDPILHVYAYHHPIVSCLFELTHAFLKEDFQVITSLSYQTVTFRCPSITVPIRLKILQGLNPLAC